MSEYVGGGAVSESTLFAALAKAQAAFPSIPKGRTAKIPTKSGGSYSYSYADLSDIISAIRKPLTDHGLSFSQRVLDGHMVTTLYHADGGVVECGHVPFAVAETLTAQEMGSALTYFRRYSLSAALGLVAEDDDDGAHANEASRGKAAPTRPEPVPMSATTATELSVEAIRVYGKGTTKVLAGLTALAKDIYGGKRAAYKTPNDITQAEAERLIPALKHLGTLVEPVVEAGDILSELRARALKACAHPPAGVVAGIIVGGKFTVNHPGLLKTIGATVSAVPVENMTADECLLLIEALGAV